MSIKIDWSWDWGYFKAVTIHLTIFILGWSMFFVGYPVNTGMGFVLCVSGLVGVSFVLFRITAPYMGQGWGRT